MNSHISKQIFQRICIFALLGFWVVLALNGCNPSQFKTLAAQVPQLTYAISAEPKTFNVVLSNESPNVFGPIYEGLTTENIVSGEIEPGLAESWQNEGQRIVFTSPYIHLFTPLSMTAVRDRISGVKYSAYGGALWNMYELKTENKARKKKNPGFVKVTGVLNSPTRNRGSGRYIIQEV